MPKYDYACTNLDCGYEVELQHSMGDTTQRMCPVCGYHLAKQLTIPGIAFKGPGFYSTDNPKR